MSCIGFKVPHETARLLSEIEVPGERENPGHFHITMFIFGDETPIGELSKAIEAAYKVACTVRPFTVRVSRVSCFPGNPSGVPIICPVESPELHQLWEDLKQAFDEAGVDYSKKYPVYKPHVTLSYAKEPIQGIEIPTVEWGAHELVLWGGDSGDRRLIVNLPFSLKDRVASRYRIGMQGLPVGIGRNRVSRLVERFKAGD